MSTPDRFDEMAHDLHRDHCGMVPEAAIASALRSLAHNDLSPILARVDGGAGGTIAERVECLVRALGSAIGERRALSHVPSADVARLVEQARALGYAPHTSLIDEYISVARTTLTCCAEALSSLSARAAEVEVTLRAQEWNSWDHRYDENACPECGACKSGRNIGKGAPEGTHFGDCRLARALAGKDPHG